MSRRRWKSHHYENVKAAKKNKFQTTCGKHFPVLSSFMTYYQVCNWINTSGVTSGAGAAYPSRVPEFTQYLLTRHKLFTLEIDCNTPCVSRSRMQISEVSNFRGNPSKLNFTCIYKQDRFLRMILYYK
jgi:hypothetical protein